MLVHLLPEYSEASILQSTQINAALKYRHLHWNDCHQHSCFLHCNPHWGITQIAAIIACNVDVLFNKTTFPSKCFFPLEDTPHPKLLHFLYPT